MSKLRISDTTSLDLLKLVDSRLLIQANSGGGKSWMMRVIAEQAAGHIQTIILDPEGEFATLREKFDFLLVGAGGEIPCEVRSASLLARKLLELQASAVIDMLDLVLYDRRRFVKAFLESLMHLPKPLWRPLLVIIDEAHVFCPEGKSEDCSEAVINLMSQGRKRSYCGILATQRISKLNKDAAAEARNKMIGLATLDLDLKRAADELGFGKDRWHELRQRDPGEFFGFGPAFPEKGIVSFRSAGVQTTHPKPGQRHKLTAPKPSEAVKQIATSLAELPQQAEAEIRDLDEAKKKIRELEKQLRERPKERVQETKIEYVDKPALKNGQLDKAASVLDHYAKLQDRETKIHQELVKLQEHKAKLNEQAREVFTPLATAIGKVTNPPAVAPGPQRHIIPEKPRFIPQTPRIIPKAAQNITESADSIPADERAISGPEQRVLNGLAELEAIGVTAPEREQVAFLAGYSNLASKGFANAMGALRTAARINYPSPGTVCLTDFGRELAASSGAPRSSAELQQRILHLLGGVHGRVLTPLIECYPNDMSREDLAAAAGYTNLASKGFANAMGRLRSLGLIEYPASGRVRARSILFLD